MNRVRDSYISQKVKNWKRRGGKEDEIFSDGEKKKTLGLSFKWGGLAQPPLEIPSQLTQF